MLNDQLRRIEQMQLNGQQQQQIRAATCLPHHHYDVRGHLPPGRSMPAGLSDVPNYHRKSGGNGGPGVGTGAKQTTGPPGANLFVFNVPQHYRDENLAATFSPFGRIVSTTVFIDKVSGRSKCFGFVSFDNSASAQLAIARMHGVELGGKRIKVQLKREN